MGKIAAIQQKDAQILRDKILENWSDFVSVYKGTGVQYTTLERLKCLFYCK